MIHRRKFIQQIASAGLTLYLPSCWMDAKKASITENAKPAVKADSVERIEESLEMNNVVFFSPNDAEYQKHQVNFNLAVPKHPKLIALPKNTQGVSEAIKYAIKMGMKVAVKSGGHSFENFSSINDGLQINLSLLNGISWLPNNQVVIEPACLLSDLYDELLPNNRILPAGSCGTVGIGGLTLGGGYGFFARKYGLTCDHVTKMTFVDGLGNIHEVDQQDKLSWALKGGGNGNFGVVTTFTFNTHPAPKQFTRHRFKIVNVDVSKTKELLELYFNHAVLLPPPCFATFIVNHKTIIVLITNFEKDTKEVEEMIQAFKAKSDKASIGVTKQLATALKNYYGIEEPLYFKNASAGYYDNYKSVEPFIEEVLPKLFQNPGMIYQINTLGGKIKDASYSEKSCYPHRDKNFLAELQYYWEENRNTKKALQAFQEIQDVIYAAGIKAHYRNYPSTQIKEWEKAYYGSNYKKLQEFKAKYDPKNLFSHQQTVKPS